MCVCTDKIEVTAMRLGQLYTVTARERLPIYLSVCRLAALLFINIRPKEIAVWIREYCARHIT